MRDRPFAAADRVSATDPDGPTPGLRAEPSGRIEVLDCLRGFALLGIVVLHVGSFLTPGGPAGLGGRGTPTERGIVLAMLALGESKFFTIFSFLFGLGFAIQLLNARRRGTPFRARFGRRLLGLLGFGVAHVALLWERDILILYALLGAVLLLFQNMAPRGLLIWIAGLLLVPSLVVAGGLAAIQRGRGDSGGIARTHESDLALMASFDRARADAIRDLGGGSYRSIMVERIKTYRVTATFLVTRAPAVLALFLLGLLVGRLGILRDVEAHLGLLRRARFWGLALGLPASLAVAAAYARLPAIPALVALFFNQYLAGPLLATGYVATFVLLARRPSWQAWLRPLAATGRMALTNYLGQSLIGTLIFHGYGLGLVGRVPLEAGLVLAVGIFVGQAVFSLVWLARFRAGPLEWLWRSGTDLAWQPLLRSPVADPR